MSGNCRSGAARETRMGFAAEGGTGWVMFKKEWKFSDQFPGAPRMKPPRREVVMLVGMRGTGVAVEGRLKRSFWWEMSWIWGQVDWRVVVK